jgi:hypothetical protein
VGAIYTYSEIFLLYHGEQLLVVEETKENWEHQVQVRHTWIFTSLW